MKRFVSSVVAALFVMAAAAQEYSYDGKVISEQEFNKIYSVFSKFYGVDGNGNMFNTSRRNLPDPETGEAFRVSLPCETKDGFHEIILSEKEIKVIPPASTIRGIYAGGGSYYKKFPVVLRIRADAPLAVEIPVLVTDKDGYDLSGEILKTPTREQFREYMASNRLFRYRKHVKRGPTFFCKHCSGTGKLKENTIAAKLSDGKCTECRGTGKNKVPDEITYSKIYL